MNESHHILIGFELNKDGAQLCYYDRKAGEPVSVASKVGTEQYLFPLLLCKMPEKDEWHFGIEADYFSRHGGILVEDLYERLFTEEPLELDGRAYSPAELLAVYMEAALQLLGVSELAENVAHLTFTTEKLTRILVEHVRRALAIQGFDARVCTVQDKSESGFYYVYSQKQEVWNRKIAFFDFSQTEDPALPGVVRDLKVTYRAMDMNRTTKPILVRPEAAAALELPEDKKERDEALAHYAMKEMSNQLFSAVFLTGRGFDQSWAKSTLAFLCRGGRRVFTGSNLFVRGACYASLEKETHHLKQLLYLGEDLIRTNVGMDMIVRGNPAYYPLISAGTNWFDADTRCRLILDDRDYLAFSINSMDGRVKKRCRMELPGLPKRPNRTTCLELSLSCPTEKECVVKVKDLGFGEMFESSGLEWEDTLPLG
ncbi:MAG: DUF5716 family protein [Lachnospiraceae bacterium]|nr:DUF5716 family protein [Lachnospiraceae bacterium]